jgi:hypothetical protein
MNEIENDIKKAERAAEAACQKAKELREMRSISIFNYIMEKLAGKTWHIRTLECCGFLVEVKSKYIETPYESDSIGSKKGVELSWGGEGYSIQANDPEALFKVIEEHDIRIATSALGNLIARCVSKPVKVTMKHVICGKCKEPMVYAADCHNGRMYACSACDIKVEVETAPVSFKED